MESTSFDIPNFKSSEFTWYDDPIGVPYGRGKSSELNILPEHKTRSFEIESEKTGKSLLFTFDYKKSSQNFWHYTAFIRARNNTPCEVIVYNDTK